MMRTGKIMVMVGMLVWGAATAQNAFAQGSEGTPVHKQGTGVQGKDAVSQRIEAMTRRLGLTPDQQAAIRPLLEEEAARLKELRGDEKQYTPEFTSKVRELRSGTFNKIRPILTPEQQQRHDALRKEAAERRKLRDGK